MKLFYKLNVTLFLTSLFLFGSAELMAQHKNMQLRAHVPYDGGLSNVWGFVDNVGNEYALVGTINGGLSIVDVSNPDMPEIKFTVPGPASSWREVRTWQGYAYVTTEAGGGVTIVNLNNLPNEVITKTYTGDGDLAGIISSVHALHIDNGKLYLYGGNAQGGRAKMFSLADPWNPTYLGTVSNSYVHDGFVRNDTLYSAQIYLGLLEIIDATDPQNPVVINSQLTPGSFTHNSWMSTDGHVIYTTDEVSGSFVTAYDISDIMNITELDRIQSNPGSGSIAHNTYVLNNPVATGHNTDFLTTSYYTDGVTLVDASRPDNLVQVGNYDTSPLAGNGFHGAWGVYPYLPSGNLLVSDIEEGLFIVTPTYKQACFLEGLVRDSIDGTMLNNAKIEVLNKSELNAVSNLTGVFKTGTVDDGTYTLVVSKPGYFTKTIPNVLLQNGVVTNQLIELVRRPNFVFTAKVQSPSGKELPFAEVRVVNAEFNYETKTDVDGNVSIPFFYTGKYAIYVGKWGHNTIFIDSTIYSQPEQLIFTLNEGYYDDFTFNYGWTVTGDAVRGMWERGKPEGTHMGSNTANPDNDVDDDFNDQCYVTGRLRGNTAGSNDVHLGTTILTSPVFDVEKYNSPIVTYSRWFFNNSGGDDTLFVLLTNGTETVLVDSATKLSAGNGSSWILKNIRVADYFTTGATTMQLVFYVSDLGSISVVEAGVDKVMIYEEGSVGVFTEKNQAKLKLNVYPNPVKDNSVIYFDLGEEMKHPASVEVLNVFGKQIDTYKINKQSGKINMDRNLPSGVYLIRLTYGSDQSIFRIVK